MSGRAKFVHWLISGFDDIPNEPMFNVIENDLGKNNGSTVAGESLLHDYGIALPLFPDLKTWQRETAAKRRCFRCWAVTRGPIDSLRHRKVVHGEQVHYAPKLLRVSQNMALIALLFLSVGCNGIRRLTGLDRHDAEKVDIPVARVLERTLPASGDITFAPTPIAGADHVRVFVKNAAQFTATPGAWYEIPYTESPDGRTTEYAVIDFAAQSLHVYNQPAAPARAITVESVPTGAFDPGVPAQ